MLLPQVVRTLPNPLFGNAFAAMRELVQRVDQFVLKLQEPLPRGEVSANMDSRLVCSSFLSSSRDRSWGRTPYSTKTYVPQELFNQTCLKSVLPLPWEREAGVVRLMASPSIVEIRFRGSSSRKSWCLS